MELRKTDNSSTRVFKILTHSDYRTLRYIKRHKDRLWNLQPAHGVNILKKVLASSGLWTQVDSINAREISKEDYLDVINIQYKTKKPVRRLTASKERR